MQARALARRPFWFALAAVAVLSAELAVVASQLFVSHPLPLSAAVIADLCAVIPLLVWLVTGSARLALRLVVIGAIAAGLLLQISLRLWIAPLELVLLVLAILAARRVLAVREAADPAEAIEVAVVALLGDHALARAVAAELGLAWFALFSWRRHPPEGFSSNRRAAWSAVVFAVIVCSLAEGTAMHFLLLRLGRWPAALGLVFHLYAILWLVGDARALALRRTQVEQGVLHLRIGLRWSADIPLAAIESVELRRAREGELALRVLGDTNLSLVLREPALLRGLMGIRKRSSRLALQLDEPQALAASLSRG